MISFNGMPNPSFAAMKASGYPVAFDAKAEERDRRALTCRIEDDVKQIRTERGMDERRYKVTSMIQYSRDVGFSAYWILHSPMTPKCRITLMAVVRSIL